MTDASTDAGRLIRETVMFYNSRYRKFELRARQMRNREIRRIVHALTSVLGRAVQRIGRASAAAARGAAAGARAEWARCTPRGCTPA